jgi:SAM-dependent methyltransferase
MNRQTQQALGAINRRFYEAHAEPFSNTRDHAWPGWERAWKAQPTGVERAGQAQPTSVERAGNAQPTDVERAKEGQPTAAERVEQAQPASSELRLLDVGCGNARFGRFVAGRCPGLHYTGVDSSGPLLEHARSALGATRHCLLRADLVSEGPAAALPSGPFDWIAVFGVLHHLPGFALRRQLVAALAQRLAPGGVLALAAWRFAGRSRFARRSLSWETFCRGESAPIDLAELEPGDHLLRWGDSGELRAVRYCHETSDDELDRLTTALGLEAVDRFLSDGREGDLNRYVVLRRPAAALP